MKASDTHLRRDGRPAPTFGAGPGADRMPVVQTVGGAAMCMQIIAFGMASPPAVASRSPVSAAFFSFGGVAGVERESSRGAVGGKGR